MARLQLTAVRLSMLLAWTGACVGSGALIAAPPTAEVAPAAAVTGAAPQLTAEVPPPTEPGASQSGVPASASDDTTSPPPPEPVARAPVLNLDALEQRLRETRAIGLFTKLSLKNQVDDLLAQFKAFHLGQSRITLHQLREKYELLLMKVVSLLQDGDPALASAVFSSREAIWMVLSDPKSFAAL
ncbi:MAG TPA: hypothetical protein VI653_21440 [Steroidobacteraceae bacterium]